MSLTQTEPKAIKIGTTNVKKVTVWRVRLPSEYQEVEYIQSTGTQYLVIGNSFSTDYKVEIDVQLTAIGGDQLLFGCTTNYRFGINAYSSYFKTITGGNSWSNTKSEDANRHTFIMDKGTTYVDGTPYSSSYVSYTYNFGLGLFDYNRIDGGTRFPAKEKLFSCKIYNGNTILHDLVPCYRKSDNVIGMYDLVNSQFYTNAGTGTFTKGNDVWGLEEKQVRPKVEPKYIQNSTLWKNTTVAYTDTQSVWISPDGAKMVVGFWGWGKSVVQYNLSTPFDVSSKGSIISSMNFGSNKDECGGLRFNDEGTIMFLWNGNNTTGALEKYILSTEWDLSTATLTQSMSFNRGTSIFVSMDGTRLYYTDYNDATWRQTTLSTAYDLNSITGTTTVYINGMYRGISFTRDGKYVFLTNSDGGGSYGTIYQYELATPRDLTSTRTEVSTFTAPGGEGCCLRMSNDMKYRTWSSGNSSQKNVEIYELS